MPHLPTSRVRFGLFELDLSTGELRKRGLKVPFQEQPFRVLARLLEAPGELVTREALRTRLWPDAVFVDFEHGLNKAVEKLRVALGDLAESPRYIETLPKRGYRFIAPVEVVEPRATAAPSSPPLPIIQLAWGERSVALGEGTHVLGRDPSSAVWIDSPLVSRRHAALTVLAGSVSIEDLGSHNGTFLNGHRLVARESLVHGDEIRVGPARMVVHAAPPATPTESVGTDETA